jgi:AraC-like DNA-binding protein
MSNQEYDVTYNDLNPTFLFVCDLQRTETETNYHCHEHIEISIIEKGEGIFHIEGKDYPVRTGDIIVFNPGVYHKSILTNPENYTTEYYIGFTDINLRNAEPNTLPLLNSHCILSLGEEIRLEIFKICREMWIESRQARMGRYFMLKAYLIQMILLLIREQEEEAPERNYGCIFKSPNKNHVVEQMIHYFNEHYAEKISLDQIGRNMYLSTFYLAKIFKSETGDTPINYLIHLRMKKAREIMKDSPELSIQDIAAKVGYDDAYHFSKLFKKHYGIPPSVYKSSGI